MEKIRTYKGGINLNSQAQLGTLAFVGIWNLYMIMSHRFLLMLERHVVLDLSSVIIMALSLEM